MGKMNEFNIRLQELVSDAVDGGAKDCEDILIFVAGREPKANLDDVLDVIDVIAPQYAA